MVDLKLITKPDYITKAQSFGAEFGKNDFGHPDNFEQGTKFFELFLNGKLVGFRAHNEKLPGIFYAIQLFLIPKYRPKIKIILSEILDWYERRGHVYRIYVKNKIMRHYDHFDDIDFKVLEDGESVSLIEVFSVKYIK